MGRGNGQSHHTFNISSMCKTSRPHIGSNDLKGILRGQNGVRP